MQRNYGFLAGDVSFKCLYLYEKKRKKRKGGGRGGSKAATGRVLESEQSKTHWQ